MLNVLAGVLVIIAGFLHSWYGRNVKSTERNAVIEFCLYGKRALIISITLLITGLLIFWLSAGILVALFVTGVYFFVLPLIMMPIIEKLGNGFFMQMWWGTKGAELIRKQRDELYVRPQTISPKTKPGPESLLRAYPLLYLYFDDFSELQHADKLGCFEIAIQSGSLGYDGFAGILADEKRFLELYRNDELKLELKDGTIIQRRLEVEYWDRIVHPEKYVRKTKDYSAHSNTQESPKERNLRELEEYLIKSENEVNKIVTAIEARYRLAKK